MQRLKEPNIPQVDFSLQSTGFEELISLPQPKPPELLDIQEDNRKGRLLDSLNKIGGGLEDSSLDFIRRENFKSGNISNHPVKPLTKDQKKIYDMMLNKELPTNRPSVADRLVERFNKPWEQLDNTARANFINQTYPRYKKLLERSEGKISRNQLAKILSEKLGRPISLGQIHGYGTNRSGQRQKTAFGRKLDEILDVTNVTPKNPMYKIPTDADIKKLKPLLDITPSNSLKNSTVDNIVKLNKKYAGIYKSGKLPSLETVLKDFPNMTSNQASNATIRLSQIYSGNKFKLFSNLDPKIKKEIENIKVNKNLGDKVFKLIGDSKFNEYRNSMYRISLGIIDEKLGNSKGTFEKLKNQARQILKDNKIPIYSPEKKNAAGKIIQKAKKGFNINEIAGVSGSAKSKAAEFSQFIDVMEGNLNQKTMANFQSKLSSAREMIENNPEMLSSKSKEINKLAKNLENAHGVKLPRLQDPDAAKYFSPKRLNELKTQGLDIVKAAERAGYTIQMPKGAQTINEFIDKPDLTRLAVIGCGRKAAFDGGRINFNQGQNLTACAMKGVEKLQGDPGKLTPGDQANVRALAKSGKAVKFLKGVLGPGAILGEVLLEGGIAANKFMDQGMPIKQALGESYINKYVLGPKSQIDVEAERAKEFAKGEDFAMAERGRRMAPFMAQSATADAQRLKDRMKQMEKVKTYENFKPNYGFTKEEFEDTMRQIGSLKEDQVYRDDFYKQQVEKPIEFKQLMELPSFKGTQEEFMEGGIASLNVNKK